MTPDDPSMPADALPLAATLLDLDVPEPCRAGVLANLAALAEHARRVAGEDPA